MFAFHFAKFTKDGEFTDEAKDHEFIKAALKEE